ncbi:phosphonate ABC transporter permease [Bacillus sp. DX1.1]|nr:MULTISPECIES: phosphonate ABC transporter permease [unclassified Bacillus (in: firmicutes)]MDM5155718.1 phosphonate ABC transporter permease [Bacillus sp. DX1.1]MDM5189230.1 phosphonate ABC transporter permease [Bacillus sp. DX4.1]WJE80019.1 phosphonate ABC transporter permease [Bacillus sp. DX3.1]
MPFLGSVYQVFGLYPEIYHAMICMEMKDELVFEDCKEEIEKENEE